MMFPNTGAGLYDKHQAKLWQAEAAREYAAAAECRDFPGRNGMTPNELQKMYQRRAAYASRRARSFMGLEGCGPRMEA